MKQVAFFLKRATYVWYALVVVCGLATTFSIALECLFYKDFFMTAAVLVFGIPFVVGVVSVSRVVLTPLVEHFNSRTIYYQMDDGSVLIEERRG